ncbi:hypothetical protein D3C78_1790450 [compost metagenome]
MFVAGTPLSFSSSKAPLGKEGMPCPAGGGWRGDAAGEPSFATTSPPTVPVSISEIITAIFSISS